MISLVDGYLVIHENGIWAMLHLEETVNMLRDKKKKSVSVSIIKIK